MRRLCSTAGMVALLFLAGPVQADAQPEDVRLLTHYTLSPDGGTFVFSWRGDLWQVPTAGGTPHRLTTHPADESRPHFAPDGKSIAFTSTRTGPEQVWLMNADGSNPRAIDTHSEGARVYGWFPDSRAVLMRARRDHHWRRPDRLYRKPLRERQRPELLFDDYGYVSSVSPDGERIAFTREGESWWRKGYRGPRASQIWIFDRKRRSFTKVTDGDHGERWPLWAPDGRHLYLSSQQDGTWNLYRHDLQSGKREQLTKYRDDGVSFPVLSADGSTMVYRQLFDTFVLQVPTPGTPPRAPRRLKIQVAGDPTAEATANVTTTRATGVAFTDDGREVAFVAGGDIWVMDTELREPKRVTYTAADERAPVFSKDMKSLYFLSETGGQTDIWKASRTHDDKFWWQNDKFQYETITKDAHTERGLALTPDGKQFVFTRASGGLWTCGLDGKGMRALVTSWDEPDFSFSPDGTWLAYAVADNDFNSDVWIKPLDGSRAPINVSVHPDNDRNPTWSPDGRTLAFTGRRWGEESDICLVALQREKHEENKRDRTIEKALKKMAGRKGKKDKRPDFAGDWEGKLIGPAPLPKGGLPLRVKLEKEGDGWVGRLTVRGQLDLPLSKIAPTEDGKAMTAQARTLLGMLAVRLEHKGKALSGTWKLPPGLEGTLTLKKGTKKPVPQVVDVERIADRIRRISIAESHESGLFWSHDSKKLAFFARIKGEDGLYTIAPPDDVKPKRLVASRGSSARWLKEGNQIVWLAAGVPASVSASGKVTRYPFTVRQVVDHRQRHEAAFDVAWVSMRDAFYDPGMAGRNWDKVRAKYRPMARAAGTRQELEQVCNLMLGELNASHMGFRALGGQWTRSGWRPITGHLGLRFDRSDDGEGLLVRHVIREGPTDQKRSRIRPGERVLKVEGYHVSRGTNLTNLLTLDRLRHVSVRVRGSDGKERDVLVQPISYGRLRGLLYDDWQADVRRHVDEASDGTLGYLHVRGMNWSSFERFEAELYKIGHGKDGLIIDVRENGGGFTTDHLLTCLTQPEHAFTIPRRGGRGYPQDRMVYARWNKPIVVLCNQNSFSNAEIFSHAIKTLKRGRVVGVRTAGGVISTGRRAVMGIASLRMPFRGWFLKNTGEDMELNGCTPDIEVWPLPGDWERGVDRQLDAGIAALLEDVATWKARPRAEPKVAPKPWPPR